MIEIKERYAVRQYDPRLEPVRKRIEQDEILVNGVRVGYCGTHRGAPLTLLVPVAESTLYQIKFELDRRDQQGCNHRKVVVCPQMVNEEENETGDS